jgi:glycosyltransferase involved in cell wall biosynthesis
MSPLTISAVIPVSNKAPHVGAAIASALAQSRPPDEILVVDDASRDGSRAVIESFTDERLRLLSRPVPGPGGYAARNLAIREARSQWIAFLDADDAWYSGHLEALARMASTAGSDVVGAFTGWERVWPDGRRQRDVFGASRGPGVTETVLDFDGFLAVWGALGTSPIWTTASVFRREALLRAGLFPEGRCKRGGDVDLWLRIMALGRALACTEVSAAYHQNTTNQVTHQERLAGSHCAWATLELLAAGAPESRRRLLADLKGALTRDDFRLHAAMERYSPITGGSGSPRARWLRRLGLEALVRLPRPVQESVRALQRRLTRRRRG